MSNTRELPVEFMEVLGYRIARFPLHLRDKKYYVSLTEEENGRLDLYFRPENGWCFSIAPGGKECVLEITDRPNTSESVENAMTTSFGAPLDEAEYAKIVKQVQAVARLFRPGLTLLPPDATTAAPPSALPE